MSVWGSPPEKYAVFSTNTDVSLNRGKFSRPLGKRKPKKSNHMMESRIEKEKKVVEQMIHLYCRKKEGNASLCPACHKLLIYAREKLDHCKFGSDKPICKKCPVHCYRPDMRKRIKSIMRWSGPRMLFYHPVSAVKHLLREL